jgi:hypothetical protein
LIEQFIGIINSETIKLDISDNIPAEYDKYCIDLEKLS